MALTQFKGRDGKAGPVAGAVQCISIGFDDIQASSTASRRIELPAGAQFQVTDVVVSADAVTGSPSLTIGDTAAGTEIVDPTTVTTNLGAVTIKDGTVDAGGFIDVVVTTGVGESASYVSISVWGYVSAAPTSVRVRDGNHY